MKVWGFYKGSGRFPHRAEIKGAMARVGYRHIELDPKAQTVRFLKCRRGTGSGRNRERICRRPDGGDSAATGMTSALITAGSSSIYGIGVPPDGKPRLACGHPAPEGRLQDCGGRLSEGRVHVHIRQLREVLPCQRARCTATSWIRERDIQRRGRCRFPSSRRRHSTARRGRNRTTSTAADGRPHTN